MVSYTISCFEISVHCKAVLEPLLDEIFYISVIPVLRHSHVEIMKSDFPFYLLSPPEK